MTNIEDFNNSQEKEDIYNNNNTEFKIIKVFNLYKDNKLYKLEIKIKDDNIIFEILNYQLILNKEDFITLINIQFKTLNDLYQFIINNFIQGYIEIKDIKNKFIKIIINQNKEINKNIELYLINKNINKDFIINELYNEYNKKFNDLENQISKLKEELNIFKKKDNENNNVIDFNNFGLKMSLTKNSYCFNNINNTFTLFNSFNDIIYLVYSTDNKSIISYDLYAQKINIEIKNAHKNYITNFRHCFIKPQKKDLIISLSDLDNHLKLWDANIWECLLVLENINNQGFLNSACFLNDNNNIYIISSNWNFNNTENIKVFNMKGEKVKDINDSNNNTVYIKSYYDIKKLKYYIITGNDGYIKSYDYYENKIYHKYSQKHMNNSYYCIIIKYFKNILKIIGSCFDGFIRIWNFHSGDILNIISSGNKGLIGICLWNDNYLFYGTNDQLLKVINIEKGIVQNIFKGLKNNLCTLKKINHSQYGECLVSQGLLNDQIKLWSFNK